MSKHDTDARDDDDTPATITPAAATAEHVTGPVDGCTSLTGAVERSKTDVMAVCTHDWRQEIGLTVGADDGDLAIEATAFLSAAEARSVADQLEALADRLDEQQ